jgi:hypothetical protein
MPRKTNYTFVVGEQKTINEKLKEGTWKPLLMSAIPRDNVPNGVIFAVMLEEVVN